jgi:hypothetical protein
LETALALPQFLAPDDHADLTLALDNTGGPRGEYRVRVHAEGQVAVQDEAETAVNLAEHEQRSLPVAVQARGPGDGAVIISVKGPAGIAFDRRLPLPVRSSAPSVLRHAVATVKPGATLSIDPSLAQGLRPETLGMSLAAGAGNDLDLAGLAQELAAGTSLSAEAVVDAAAVWLQPAAVDPPGRPAPLEASVQALAGYQGADGGFSSWGAGPSDLRLSACAAEFLERAKAHGAVVADAVVQHVLDFLAVESVRLGNAGSSDPDAKPPVLPQQTLDAIAYAEKVLATAGRLDPFQLHYFSDRFQSQIRSGATAGFVAAAFAAIGDKPTAAASFARAATMPSDPSAIDPTGTDLRDQAELLAMMVESGAVADASVSSVAAKLYATAAARRQFSASEASWLLRAMSQMPPGPAFKLSVGDKTVAQSTPFAFAATGGVLPAIKNVGDAPIHVALSVAGTPAQGEFKDQAGYEIQRWYFDGSGKPIDPAAMKLGDSAVVVLTGRYTGQGDAHPVVIDPLPAGWKAEAADIEDAANRYPWLKDLSGATHAAIANSAYVATPKLLGDRREFRLAYVVRAAVRGQFALPGAVIQDSVQAGLQARTPAGRTKVDPAS